MVELNDHKLVIILHVDDPQIYLDRVRESITDVTTILIESDVFCNNSDASGAVATLVRLNGELT